MFNVDNSYKEKSYIKNEYSNIDMFKEYYLKINNKYLLMNEKINNLFLTCLDTIENVCLFTPLKIKNANFT